VNTIAGPRQPGFGLLSFSLFGGVAIWMVHLAANSALVSTSCAHHSTLLLNLSTAVTAVIAALSAAAGALVARRYGSIPGPFQQRTRFLGFLGMFFGVASLILILLEGAPVLVLNECAR